MSCLKNSDASDLKTKTHDSKLAFSLRQLIEYDLIYLKLVLLIILIIAKFESGTSKSIHFESHWSLIQTVCVLPCL